MNNYARPLFGDKSASDYSLRKDAEYYQEDFIQNRNSRGQLIKNSFPKYVEQTIDQAQLRQNLNAIREEVYELIFLKEGVMSLIGEQKMKMGDFMRQMKKALFQLGLKIERQGLEKSTKSNQEYAPQYKDDLNHKQYTEMRLINDKLVSQNKQLKDKYESMLIRYRNQIESIQNVVSRPQNPSLNEQIHELRQQLFQSQQVLIAQQQKYSEKVKYLQTQILGLEDQYYKEKQIFERQLQEYKQRQRQINFQESELQRKNILLIQRERMISERQILLKQEKNTIERRQNKISDYQHNQLRRERQKIQDEKNSIRNQYYTGSHCNRGQSRNNSNRHNIDTRSEREKSIGRMINSRTDINARLKEIQMEKKNNGYGFMNSRVSDMRSQRSSSKTKNQVVGISYQPSRPSAPPQNVNYKLESMLESLQKDLDDMK